MIDISSLTESLIDGAFNVGSDVELEAGPGLNDGGAADETAELRWPFCVKT